VVQRDSVFFRYRTADPAQTNPLVLKRLTEKNIPVLTLAEVPRSLEALYLRAVAEDENSL
jgi:hypothetical protein